MSTDLKLDNLLDLELLRTFVMVAKTGELKKAAEAIFRSQAAVSMQMKKLEDSVNCVLLHRSNRGIQLTEAGKTLLNFSEQFLKLNSATLSALGSQEITGKITFGIPTDYAPHFLQHFMPLLRNEIPGLDAKIICERSRQLRAMVDSADVDIAIVAAEERYSDDVVLWSERLIWAKPITLQIAEGESIPVAIYDDDCIVSDICFRDLKQSKTSFRQVLRSPILENIATSVRSGFAVALLPESLFKANEMEALPPTLLKSNQNLNICMITNESLDDAVMKKIESCLRLTGKTMSSYSLS
ncbi:hypothetical protein VINI7043_16393 [Vibrio nigripulchritudo ATCC 27043]|uniref:LysR family transcriptional regulator n=1 Tax=Vibrio nigripulchritudo TaxID=28173 RepID=UPI00021C2A72|nr:LysR family transcriptional regulator [Vibrio nigripulchritudo]EGU56222.1 hypothetical protein VINI7043_16393 [Vibrio nigripulchritudo ATCC 27043]